MGRVDIDIRGKVVPAASVAAIAARQHGVVSRAQLFRAGVTRATIDRLLRSGWLHSLHRGVYAAGHRGVGQRGKEMAAVLWAGAEHAVGRRSAAAMWGVLPPWRGDVHVLGPRTKRTRGVIVHKTRVLPRTDVTRHFGIPVTTPARTLIDLATVVDAATLEDALEQAQVRGLVKPEALMPRATGALARALGVAEPTRSKLERAFRRFVAQHDLPPPVINGFVEGFEVDVHWPQARLVVEVDGWEHHRSRRAFDDDRERDAILQAAGWRAVRVTARQFHAATAQRLRGMTRAAESRPPS